MGFIASPAPVAPSPERLEAYRHALRHALLNHGVKLGEGLDDSGRPYNWMIDCREVLLSAESLHHAARLLWERLKPYRPQAVGGMTLAANPLTIALLYESRADGYPIEGFIIRKEPKGNGLRKWVEGPPLAPGSRVILLDDLVNSGETQRKALDILKPFGVDVVAVGAMIDIERAGSTWLQGRGIPLECLFTLKELGIDLNAPRRPNAHPLAWSWGPLNHGRYPAPKSSPLVTPEGIFVGSDAGFLVSLTLDGRERWRVVVRDRERGIHATPLLHDGRLYFGAYDGFVYCLDSTSGKVLWETRPGQWVGSSPALDSHRNRILIGVEAGEASGSLVALEARTGQKVWELRTRHYVHSSPCFDGARDQVLVGSNDYALYAADAESGRLRWQVVTGGEIKGDPVVDAEGRCFVGSYDGFLYAVEAATGQVLWKRHVGKRLQVRPLLVDDRVVVGSQSSRVVSLDRATGEVSWIATTGGSLSGGAALAGAWVAIGSADGRLHLLDKDTGVLEDVITTSGPVMTTPGVGMGLCVFPSFDGGLRAFALD